MNEKKLGRLAVRGGDLRWRPEPGTGNSYGTVSVLAKGETPTGMDGEVALEWSGHIDPEKDNSPYDKALAWARKLVQTLEAAKVEAEKDHARGVEGRTIKEVLDAITVQVYEALHGPIRVGLGQTDLWQRILVLNRVVVTDERGVPVADFALPGSPEDMGWDESGDDRWLFHTMEDGVEALYGLEKDAAGMVGIKPRGFTKDGKLYETLELARGQRHATL